MYDGLYYDHIKKVSVYDGAEYVKFQEMRSLLKKSL